MKTKQFLSTICYSRTNVMFEKLVALYNSGKIDFFVFIPHHPEEDEKKEHSHLLIFPNQPIETRDLDVLLIDPQSDGQTLGTCGIWHTVGKNNVSDWLLYGMHDPMYMRVKGYDVRKYTYEPCEFYTNNADALDTLIYDAYHTSTFTFNRRILDIILKSKDITQTGKELVLNGYIPLNSTCSFHHMLQILKE